ncbi:MAG: TonB-dependent receptor [Opitutus sp.]|nr:TonB-dependent receptor [Opitutus sp.]
MKPISLPVLLSLGALVASAQTNPPSPASEPVNLEEFVVTGNPLGRAQDEVAQPTSVLAGQRLTLARQVTIGDTLAGEPGISSSSFGPGASRPVIRGLGGDRVRVLQGGIGTLDASVVSPDHAVSVDPLLIDRIEIVRGPATLLYGGSAIGGVVNVIDARIPEELPARAREGRTEVRLGGAANERAAAGLVTGKAGQFAWRLDGFTRRTDDVQIPGLLESDALRAAREAAGAPGGARPVSGYLPNSATDTSGAGAAVAYHGARGHLGISYSGLDSLYGVPSRAFEDGEGVRIDLRQRRWDLHAEAHEPLPWLRVAKLQFGRADYRHAELEGDEIGTRVGNRAYEGRIELLHTPLAGLEGALGAQVSRSDFTAAGEEAFVPSSVTTNQAVFLYEEVPGKALTWQFGGRVERQKIAPAAGTGLASRTHTSSSLSAGAIWKLPATTSLAVSLSRSERAPNAQELFADGPHAGTGSYEIGDASLGRERAHGIDVSLRKRTGGLTGVATAFATDFDGFIFEEPTGAELAGLPVYRFVQNDARFRGAELELIAHLHDAAPHQVDLRLVTDTVRATNRTTGQPLPRITPTRLGAGIDYRHGALSASLDVRQGLRAKRLAPGELPTPGYTQVNLAAAWRFKLGPTDGEVFARASNLTDETIRLHTSFVKDIAPQPGRSITAGLRLTF